jgi:RNA 2',3'-cyclic 3'-phosphodiesterase
MKKRLFIAISLTEDVRHNLVELQQTLRKFARDAKWVKVEGIHLTLKFLGYVEEDKISEISNSMQPIAQSTQPFPIQVNGCGFFPNSRRPNVLWGGVISDQLQLLQKQIEDATEQLGFERENRPFSPHLTLARFRDHHGLTPLILETEKWRDKPLGSWNATDFVLYESILHRQGAEYHKLNVFSFHA